MVEKKILAAAWVGALCGCLWIGCGKNATPITSAGVVAAAPSALSAVSPVEIEAGTTLRVRLEQTLNLESVDFRGTLAQAVLVNGQVAIPAGATVRGTVIAPEDKGARPSLELDWLNAGGQAYAIKSRPISDAGARGGVVGGAAAWVDALAGGGHHGAVQIPAQTVLGFRLAAPLQVVPPTQ